MIWGYLYDIRYDIVNDDHTYDDFPTATSCIDRFMQIGNLTLQDGMMYAMI